MRSYRQSGLCFLFLAVLGTLCGCATPGPPKPPSLQIPSPVTDLRGTRNGDTVTLSWTAPAQTSDDENIRHPGTTRICRDLDVANRCTALAELPSQVGKQQQYTDTLPPDLAQRTGLLVYHVQAFNPAGKSSEPSNAAVVPVCPTTAAPASFQLEPSRTGITLRWQGAMPSPTPGIVFLYRVQRRDAGTTKWTALAAIPAGSPDLSYTDTTPEFGHDYEYTIVAVSHFTFGGQDYEVEGNAAPPRLIAFRDVFPPAPPTGLQAVYAGIPGQDAIDLSWNAEQERELAGYNVYRHQAGSAPVRLNTDLIPGTSFHDATVVPGQRYFYAITAVDAHGVESKPSAEASEAVPAAPSQD